MADTILFNGISTATPSVMSAVNDAAMAPTASPGGTNLVLVGQSTGGIPGRLYAFGTPQAAAATLIGGELLVAVTKAFAPSAATGAPATIYAMRVGSMTSGSLTLTDVAGNPAIVLTPNQAGTPALASKAMVSAGSLSGFKAQVGISGGAVLVGDNLSQTLFTVFYTGAGANPVFSASRTAYQLQAGAQSVTLPVSTFGTVGAVVDAINSTPGWTAVVTPGVAPNASSAVDQLSSTAVPGAGLAITANLWAIINWINGNAAGGFFTAAAAPTPTVQPAIMTSFAFATGATNPSVQLSDWVNAYVALQSANVQAIATLSPLPAVQGASDAHVQYMSGTGRKERRNFTGPALGTSVVAAQTLPLALNSDRTSLCWPGYYDFNAAGALTLYAPYMTAAIVAAGFASLSPGQTMTNVALSIQGLEVQANAPTDTDPLILSGVTVVRQDTSGFVVVRAISTWLQNNNFDRVEVSCGYAVDYVCRTVRAAQKALLGSDGKAGQGVSPLTVSRVQAVTVAALNGCAVPPPSGPGALVGDANSPPWSNLQLTASGDTIGTQFQCSPPVPLNFITNAVSIVPYSGSVTVSLTTSAST